MEKMNCIDLSKCLVYDEDINMYIAFHHGNYATKVRISNDRNILIGCKMKSDVLFAISCKGADICFVKNIGSANSGQLDITNELSAWGVVTRNIPNGDWCEEIIEDRLMATFILGEEFFVVEQNGNKQLYGE